MAASDSRLRRAFSTIRDALFRKDRIVDGEQRWHAVGAVERAALLVVYVYRMEDENRGEEIVRIISAREANERERRIYIQQALE
jgi:uncharacterized protein